MKAQEAKAQEMKAFHLIRSEALNKGTPYLSSLSKPDFLPNKPNLKKRAALLINSTKTGLTNENNIRIYFTLILFIGFLVLIFIFLLQESGVPIESPVGEGSKVVKTDKEVQKTFIPLILVVGTLFLAFYGIFYYFKVIFPFVISVCYNAFLEAVAWIKKNILSSQTLSWILP